MAENICIKVTKVGKYCASESTFQNKHKLPPFPRFNYQAKGDISIPHWVVCYYRANLVQWVYTKIFKTSKKKSD